MSTPPSPLTPVPSTSGLLAYYCQVSPDIQDSLTTLQACQKAIELFQPEPAREQQWRQESLLQSSLYSARIEGNPLKREELDLPQAAASRHKQEIRNLNRAYDWVARCSQSTPVNQAFLAELHRQTMAQLTSAAGQLRREESAIFNQAGVAVYLAPSPHLLKPQLSDLCAWVQKNDYPPAVAAVMAHYIFEKIHPFLDGNGRVGRLLLFHLLHRANLSLHGLLVVEKILAERRDEYYDQLAVTSADRTPYVAFMLRCLAEASEAALAKLRRQSVEQPSDSADSEATRLLPRRQELLNIIRDHQQVSFDFLSRRFPTIKHGTLHNDLACLQRAKLIRKLGNTRGALYTSTSALD